jgi:hypothetical protein
MTEDAKNRLPPTTAGAASGSPGPDVDLAGIGADPLLSLEDFGWIIAGKTSISQLP